MDCERKLGVQLLKWLVVYKHFTFFDALIGGVWRLVIYDETKWWNCVAFSQAESVHYGMGIQYRAFYK